MKTQLIFALFAILLLTPWPVAYAYDNAMAGEEPVQIEVAGSSVAPSWSTFGGAIGGVTNPGDLFYIDTTNSTTDILVTLHLTNAEELIRYYRYLILNVGIYVDNGIDQWEPAAATNGETLPDTYITMRNGKVSFGLPGYARHKVTVDSGSYYCFGNSSNGGSGSPKFYLTVE